MKITNALPMDASRLTEIAFNAKRYWNYPEAWIQLWVDDLTITEAYVAEHQVWKVELNNQVAGWISLEESGNPEEAEIGFCWVNSKFIGKGCGRKLVETLLEHCRLKGILQLTVIADPNAASFYERFDFQKVGVVESKPAGRFLPLLKRKITASS